MLLAALARMKKKVPLHVHSYNQFVLASMAESLDGWRTDGFRKADGSELKNALLWKNLARELERTCEGKITVHYGEHSYHQWMISEMKREGG